MSKRAFEINGLTVALLFLYSLGFASRCFAESSAHADHAMVVSASRLASEAGVGIMREGGNAFDAAAHTQPGPHPRRHTAAGSVIRPKRVGGRSKRTHHPDYTANRGTLSEFDHA